MYFRLSEAILREMGQYVSRLDMESDDTETNSNPSAFHSGNASVFLDNQIAHLTRLRSHPNEGISKVAPGKCQTCVSMVNMLARREANSSRRGRFTSADRAHAASRFLPLNGPWHIDQMNSRTYVSQFSTDGSLFISGFQGSHIRIYDVDNGWKVQKNIVARSLRWTITDTSLSPDQQHLVYSSMSPLVHIVDVGSAAKESLANVTDIHDGLDFSAYGDGGYSFGIFSVKFSTDGKELVAGSSDDAIYVYDLEANKLSLRILAHTSDVNTVCFADESGHLIFSGSDDNLCKVWDRRCFIARGKPAGIMMGHLEGITFIDSRGDGRYFISNGKDQCIKLWDVRKMSSNVNCDLGFRTYDWDYRWMEYPTQARNLKHPCDQSVATYKGHSVLRTLIRCYFSPKYRYGSQLITNFYFSGLQPRRQVKHSHLSAVMVQFEILISILNEVLPLFRISELFLLKHKCYVCQQFCARIKNIPAHEESHNLFLLILSRDTLKILNYLQNDCQQRVKIMAHYNLHVGNFGSCFYCGKLVRVPGIGGTATAIQFFSC